MFAYRRAVGLMVLAALGGLTGAQLFRSDPLRAGPQSVPARTAQRPDCDVPGPPLPPTPVPAGVEGPPAPADPPVPVVAIHVRVPASAPSGQELEYRVVVENTGQGDAHHVLVRNPLPANARFVRATPAPTSRDPELRWDLGTLRGGASREIVLVLAPTGTGDVRNCARVQFEHGQCVTTKINRPAIALRKTGPSQAVLYDMLTYKLEVTNSGETPLNDVVVTDTLPEGLEHSSGKNPLTWQVGTLEPGRSRVIEYQAVAKAAGRLCNRALATAAGGLRDEAESCTTVGEPKLSLHKTGPTQQYTNLAADYQITVSNPGTAPTNNVILADPIPAGATFVSATASGRLVGDQVQWTIGTLPPKSSRTVDVRLKVRAAGRLCNRASATADRELTAQAEACTDFLGISALLVELADTDDPVEVGSQTSYIVTIRNLGTTAVTHVRVEATVPEQMAVTRAVGPADNRKEGRRLLYEPLTLAAGGEVKYRIDVKALRPGDVRFKVDVTADQLTAGKVHEEESTTLYSDVGPTRPQPSGGQ
jgi:uncharacterized repeat protein (TIGR01451 family)